MKKKHLIAFLWLSNLNFFVPLFPFLFSEWCLHAQFIGFDMHIRLFAWHLHSCVYSVAYWNLTSPMDACVWCGIIYWHCAHHHPQSSIAKLQQIHFPYRWNFASSFCIGRWIHVKILPYITISSRIIGNRQCYIVIDTKFTIQNWFGIYVSGR